jgi:hypothetical protein
MAYMYIHAYTYNRLFHTFHHECVYDDDVNDVCLIH